MKNALQTYKDDYIKRYGLNAWIDKENKYKLDMKKFKNRKYD